ncbi:MAG: RnfABCDGE type electron transport complex subunit D [Bacteroidales bacterium]|nr:RnfABCDGE type electron transport complex subunit D [Bacteroidales bacterium]
MDKLIVSPSPHTHGPESTQTIMRDVLIALAPAMLVSILASGWSVLMLILVGAAACVLTEFLIQKYLLKRPVTVSDLSAVVTGCLLALNLPPNSPWWLIVVGSVVAIGVAKMTFGGLGQNIFNPALVGRVFLLVSFPVLMTSWTDSGSLFGLVDAFSGATPLGAVKEGLKNGMTLSEMKVDDLSFTQQFFFNMGGSAGEFSAIALILGFIYLLCRRVIKATIPVTILCTVFVLSGIFWLANPERFTNPLFNVFTGGLLLGAIFMATDYVTSPMTTKGQIIFGIGIGVITVFVRYFGSYPEGVSFAILIMNCTVPLLNKYCKPRRFGEVRKNG